MGKSIACSTGGIAENESEGSLAPVAKLLRKYGEILSSCTEWIQALKEALYHNAKLYWRAGDTKKLGSHEEEKFKTGRWLKLCCIVA